MTREWLYVTCLTVENFLQKWGIHKFHIHEGPRRGNVEEKHSISSLMASRVDLCWRCMTKTHKHTHTPILSLSLTILSQEDFRREMLTVTKLEITFMFTCSHRLTESLFLALLSLSNTHISVQTMSYHPLPSSSMIRATRMRCCIIYS